MTYEVLAKKAM